MAGEAPIIMLLLFSGLWIVSACDFGDTNLINEDLKSLEVEAEEIAEDYVHGEKFKDIVLKPLEAEAKMIVPYYIPGKKFNIILESLEPVEAEEIGEDDIGRDVYKNITDVESLLEKIIAGEFDIGYTNQHIVSSVKATEIKLLDSIKIDPLSFLKKDKKVFPSNSKIIELQESKENLATKMRGLNQDLQKSGLELAHQVKTYLTDLAFLKKNLTAEMEQLKTDYEDLITTVQQQEDDFYASLRYLGLEHVSPDLDETKKSAD